MWQLLAKLGKSKFGQNAMPVVCVGSGLAYSSIHLLLHEQVRNFFAAQAPSGRREKISEHLQQLITETHDTASKNGLQAGSTNALNTKTVIKWFSSCTIEPIQFGSSRARNGLLVGLPNFFNYQQTDDIPDSAFDIQKISFIRSPQDKKTEDENKIQEDLEARGMGGGGGGVGVGVGQAPPVKSVLVRKINRNSDEGQEYMNSLVLTDKAKKFSIARELFLGDSFRSLVNLGVYFLSFTLAITAGRSAVNILKLHERHITQRLPFYGAAGCLGWANYSLITNAADQQYAELVDKKAKDMGEDYVEGAEEYVKKRAIRNRILGINNNNNN